MTTVHVYDQQYHIAHFIVTILRSYDTARHLTALKFYDFTITLNVQSNFEIFNLRNL